MKSNEAAGQAKNVKYHNPPNVLRQKVGKGGIDPQILQMAEEFIAANQIDFTPHAEKILQKLAAAIKVAKKQDRAERAVIDTISGPIMELKANGAMFRYFLVTEIADVMLTFLENIDELNDDAFEIIGVHQKTLEAILSNVLMGDGGKEGRALAQELYDACNRYRKKYEI
ncbi:MAG TPA: hypothetical protein VIG74_07030, partial [Alphaproteobacteria bacterium]